MANDKTNKISTYQIFSSVTRSLANSLKLENHTSKTPFFIKEGLFANCYSTIHGQNLNTHTHTHTRTHTQVRSFAVWRKFKSSTLLLSLNFTRGRSQAETSLSLLHIDQFTSFQQQEICLVYLLSVEFDSWSGVSACSMCFRVSMETSSCCWLLRDVTGEALLWLVGFFLMWWRSYEVCLAFLRIQVLKFLSEKFDEVFEFFKWSAWL